jgi:putative acetyltransferase
VHLRPYRTQDAAATRGVFERSVHTTASINYASEQLDAWAPLGLDEAASAAWAEARAAAHTIVAVEDDEVIGFSDLVDGAALDMLYVDPRVSRRGVGSALIASIVSLAQESGAATIETHASLTARPLLERHGFVVVEQCAPVVRGIEMTNFRMRRVFR